MYFVGGETEIICRPIIAIMCTTCPEYHHWRYKLILWYFVLLLPIFDT